jgi:hypothetical protein
MTESLLQAQVRTQSVKVESITSCQRIRSSGSVVLAGKGST